MKHNIKSYNYNNALCFIYETCSIQLINKHGVQVTEMWNQWCEIIEIISGLLVTCQVIYCAHQNIQK